MRVLLRRAALALYPQENFSMLFLSALFVRLVVSHLVPAKRSPSTPASSGESPGQSRRDHTPTFWARARTDSPPQRCWRVRDGTCESTNATKSSGEQLPQPTCSVMARSSLVQQNFGDASLLSSHRQESPCFRPPEHPDMGSVFSVVAVRVPHALAIQRLDSRGLGESS